MNEDNTELGGVMLYCPNRHTWIAPGAIDESGFTLAEDAPKDAATCPWCGDEAEGLA